MQELPLIVIVLQIEQHVDQSESISEALMTLEHQDRLFISEVGYEYEFVLHLIVWIADALFFGEEIREVLLRVYAVLHLAKPGKLVLELLLVHLLVVVLAHDLD